MSEFAVSGEKGLSIS